MLIEVRDRRSFARGVHPDRAAANPGRARHQGEPGSDRGDKALSELWRLIENTRFAVQPHSCAECEWHDLMALIERCHREALAQ